MSAGALEDDFGIWSVALGPPSRDPGVSAPEPPRGPWGRSFGALGALSLGLG